MLDILGKGSFGQVVRAFDYKVKKYLAIKVIRNKKRFQQPALIEVNILKKLKEALDKDPTWPVIAMLDAFSFRSHICINFELLGINLYEYIKREKYHGLPLTKIRRYQRAFRRFFSDERLMARTKRFAKEILRGLTLLKTLKIVHCDLKPENILIQMEDSEEHVKIIDFGSSCLEDEKLYTYIQSRFYRSPEIILGLDYGPPIDMWSFGCVLAELASGHPIFPGENETDQLGCIMDVIGVPAPDLLQQCTRKRMFFGTLLFRNGH